MHIQASIEHLKRRLTTLKLTLSTPMVIDLVEAAEHEGAQHSSKHRALRSS